MFPTPNPESLARIAEAWTSIFLPTALKGSLWVGLLLLAHRLMRSASASARHLMWVLGMVGLLLLPVLDAGLPSWQVVPVPIPVPISLSIPGALAFATAGSAPSLGGDATTAPVGGPSSAAPARFVRSGPADTSTPLGVEDVPPAVWGFSLWLSGMLPLSLRLGWGMARLRRLRREAWPLRENGWPALLRSSCRDLGVDAPPALLVSPRALVPMTWGLRSPVVILPKECDDWPEELRRQVLLHEVAHVRRRDCLTQYATQCACLIHWFNPLVWLAAQRIRVERERACDDRVLAAGARPSTYAHHLLQIAGRLGARERALSAGLALARRSRIFDRLDALLDAGRCRRAPGGRTVAVAAGLILACVTGLSVLGPMARAHEEDPPLPTSKGEPALPPLPATPALPPLPAAALAHPDSRASHGTVTWETRTNGTQARLELKGAIEFDQTYTAIVRMDEDAHFRLEAKKGRHRTILEAEAGADGRPVYKYKVGRDIRPFDAEASAWLAETLEPVLLEVGIDADVRVQRLYAQEGGHGVLALIDRVESEYAKGIYCCEFFSLDGLGDDEIVEVLQRVRREVDSDYIRATILISYVDGYLHRAGTREVFGACLSAMKSDYETRRVLQAGIEREGRAPAELTALLGAVGGMRSDYEAAQFLGAFDRDQLADEGTRKAYFAALDGLQSDYEKAGVLVSLVRGAGSDPVLRQACLDATERLDSDYERARVVRALR